MLLWKNRDLRPEGLGTQPSGSFAFTVGFNPTSITPNCGKVGVAGRVPEVQLRVQRSSGLSQLEVFAEIIEVVNWLT